MRPCSGTAAHADKFPSGPFVESQFPVTNAKQAASAKARAIKRGSPGAALLVAQLRELPN
jgi:hypothetical protein